jgi:hypothetical protein
MFPNSTGCIIAASDDDDNDDDNHDEYEATGGM